MDLNDFAPYPETETEVTAEALARHEAVHAFTLMREASRLSNRMFTVNAGTPGPSAAEIGQYAETAREAQARFLVTLLLRAVAEHAPEAADEVARSVWRSQRGVDDRRDFLWHWLREYGIDVDEVEQATAERRAA